MSCRLLRLMQLGLGLIGVGGLLLGVPEYLMFWLFLGVFAAYFLLISAAVAAGALAAADQSLAWPAVGAGARHLRWLSAQGEVSGKFLAVIGEGLAAGYDYQLSVTRWTRSGVRRPQRLLRGAHSGRTAMSV
jgi:hypothetical protein